MSTLKQIEQTAAEAAYPEPAYPAVDMADGYRDSMLRAPSGQAPTGIAIQQRRLSEIPRHLLRVSCRRCDRLVEVQTADAIRLYGAHATWKEVGTKLLDITCQQRTGSHAEDGCWPSFDSI